jgi:hypothetical protein
MSRSSRFIITLPEPISDAIVGESIRTSERTSKVIADALIECFPDYVARRMREDLDTLK